METTFTWEIKVKNCPLLIKKCSHCDSDRFYCSDKFRMNAQKKNIDFWLIYRCVKCDNTCNMTLLSRTKPDLIDKKLFHSFSMNDREVAWQYAFSAGMASKNNLQLDYDSVEYEVKSDISPEGIMNMTDETISIRVKCDFDLNLKLSSLIKRCLPLSTTQLKRMFDKGSISLLSGKQSHKSKVKSGDAIIIDRECLLDILGYEIPARFDIKKIPIFTKLVEEVKSRKDANR